jgi:hypothetical protein
VSVSGDLQQEKKGHKEQEHLEDIEVEGPALPGRVMSIAEPPPPPAIELPGPGDEAGDNDLLATIAPASIDIAESAAPDVGEPDGGGAGDKSSRGGGGGGKSDKGGGEGASAPAAKTK